MEPSAPKERMENHANKKKYKYFALNDKLETGKLSQFKLMLQKFEKSDRKKLLTNVGEIYGSPLLKVIKNNKLDFVKYLVEICGVDVSPDDTEGKSQVSPLSCAYDLGHISIVKYLLSKGADPNTARPLGQHLLFEACKRRQLSLVKYLLQRKLVDVNMTDGMGNNCAYQLFLPKKQIKGIIRGPRKVPPPSRLLSVLISHGLDLTHVNRKFEPLLQHIIDRRNLPSLRMLEESGTPSALTLECNGLPPIMYAAFNPSQFFSGHITGQKVVNFLLNSDSVCVADKIYAVNLLAVQLKEEERILYLLKAIEIRNQAWPNFNYAEYRERNLNGLVGGDNGSLEKRAENAQSAIHGIRDIEVCTLH